MSARRVGVLCLSLFLPLGGCDEAGSNKKASGPKTAAKAAGPSENGAGAKPAEADRPAPKAAAQPAPPAVREVPEPPPSASGPRWSLPSPVHDFGEVWAGEYLRHPFEFLNVGDQVLRLDKPKPRCACSVAEDYTKEVAPGQKGVIPFRLNTANKSGPVSEWLTIRTNDPLHPEMKIWMKGVVKTVCKLEVIADGTVDAGARNAPGIVALRNRKAHFGNISADQSLYRVIRMTNTSGMPLVLQILPMRSALLTVKDKTGAIPCPFDASIEEIEPGQVFELTVTGTPPFRVGTTRAGINFRTNIPGRETYTLTVTASVPPRIEIRPFKVVTNLEANLKQRFIRIINHGTTPFEVTAIAASSPDFRLRRIPASAAEPNTTKFELMLPPGDYVPPPYGEIIRIETTDAELPVIEIPVLPHLRNPPTERPADRPLKWYPGKM